jgi:hypothetical protein
MALKQKAQQWVCNAEGLTVTKDAAGQTVNTFTAKKSTDYTATATTTNGLAVLDDYDSWCEFGTVCHRKISNYIAETKGNAAYGDQSGVIGNYDAILRTNLNGRQGQWRSTVIWDNGPALTFSSTQVQCVEDSWAPIICGNHGLPNATVTTYSPTWRHDYGVIYGNLLNNADPYHAAFQTIFTPAGYPAYRAANLASMSFTCPSSGNCYFP